MSRPFKYAEDTCEAIRDYLFGMEAPVRELQRVLGFRSDFKEVTERMVAEGQVIVEGEGRPGSPKTWRLSDAPIQSKPCPYCSVCQTCNGTGKVITIARESV